MNSKKKITEQDARREGDDSPAVREERYRIAEWIAQTLDEGWLPTTVLFDAAAEGERRDG
jgi:hypothetical protein